MSLQESGEMYLETIYMLSLEKPDVRAIDVCERLGYSKPSVSRAMSILKKDGYVAADSSGFLTLTESGLEVAKTMYTRHNALAEIFITLGVNEKTAFEDACRIEHVISEESFLALQKHAKKAKK